MDVAHNLDGIKNLLKLKELRNKELVVVWGISKINQTNLIHEEFLARTNEIFLINGNNTRSLNIEEM